MPPLTLDGTTGVSAVQADAVESTDLPSGSVIQVKHAISESEVTSSGNNVDVSLGLTVTISPTSINSKFLIFGKIGAFIDSSGVGFGIKIKRDTTVIRNASLEAYISDGVDSLRATPSASIIDSPNTTNSLTFEVLSNQEFGPIRYNESNGDRQKSEIIVMEIAG